MFWLRNHVGSLPPGTLAGHILDICYSFFTPLKFEVWNLFSSLNSLQIPDSTVKSTIGVFGICTWTAKALATNISSEEVSALRGGWPCFILCNYNILSFTKTHCTEQAWKGSFAIWNQTVSPIARAKKAQMVLKTFLKHNIEKVRLVAQIDDLFNCYLFLY